MAGDIAKLSVEERRAWLQGKSKDEIAAAMRETPPEALVEAGLKAIAEIGTYSAKLVKEERVGGELRPQQTLKMLLRESPFAARLEFVSGPSSGRKVLYDSGHRPKEMRVKEGGMLGLVGALWIALDSGLARRDTNHSITELGIGPLLRIMKKDVDAAQPLGGLSRKDEGFDKHGRYCIVYSAPPSGRNLYAQKTRACIDVETMIPMEVQVHDSKGLLETYVWSEVERKSADAKTFTAEAAGL